MNRGKKVCKILKEIRQQIAERNDIELFISECHYQGECKGTCPKCEAEVRYLENELNQRRQLGKAVALTGISLGMAGAFTGCGTPAQKNTQTYERVVSVDMVKIPDSLANAQLPPHKSEKMRFMPQVVELSELEGDIIKEFPCVEDTAAKSLTPSVIEAKDEVDGVDTADFIALLGDVRSIGDIVEDRENMVYQFVEEMPEYPGGEEKLRKFIKDNLVYPEGAHESRIQGTVYLSFVVEKDGNLSDIKVIRGIGGGCDEEAIRIVKKMPKWKPGKQGGENVAVKYTIPVIFRDEK